MEIPKNKNTLYHSSSSNVTFSEFVKNGVLNRQKINYILKNQHDPRVKCSISTILKNYQKLKSKALAVERNSHFEDSLRNQLENFVVANIDISELPKDVLHKIFSKAQDNETDESSANQVPQCASELQNCSQLQSCEISNEEKNHSINTLLTFSTNDNIKSNLNEESSNSKPIQNLSFNSSNFINEVVIKKEPISDDLLKVSDGSDISPVHRIKKSNHKIDDEFTHLLSKYESTLIEENELKGTLNEINENLNKQAEVLRAQQEIYDEIKTKKIKIDEQMINLQKKKVDIQSEVFNHISKSNSALGSSLGSTHFASFTSSPPSSSAEGETFNNNINVTNAQSNETKTKNKGNKKTTKKKEKKNLKNKNCVEQMYTKFFSLVQEISSIVKPEKASKDSANANNSSLESNINSNISKVFDLVNNSSFLNVCTVNDKSKDVNSSQPKTKKSKTEMFEAKDVSASDEKIAQNDSLHAITKNNEEQNDQTMQSFHSGKLNQINLQPVHSCIDSTIPKNEFVQNDNKDSMDPIVTSRTDVQNPTLLDCKQNFESKIQQIEVKESISVENVEFSKDLNVPQFLTSSTSGKAIELKQSKIKRPLNNSYDDLSHLSKKIYCDDNNKSKNLTSQREKSKCDKINQKNKFKNISNQNDQRKFCNSNKPKPDSRSHSFKYSASNEAESSESTVQKLWYSDVSSTTSDYQTQTLSTKNCHNKNNTKQNKSEIFQLDQHTLAVHADTSRSQSERGLFNTKNESITSIQVDGNHIYVANQSGYMCRYHIGNTDQTVIYSNSRNKISSIIVYRATNTIYSGGTDGILRCHNIDNGRLKHFHSFKLAISAMDVGNTILFVGFVNGIVYRYGLMSDQLMNSYRVCKKSLYNLKIIVNSIEDINLLIAAPRELTIRKSNDGSLLHTITTESYLHNLVCVNSNYICFGYYSGIQIIDCRTRCVYSQIHKGKCTALAKLDDKIFVGTAYGEVFLYLLKKSNALLSWIFLLPFSIPVSHISVNEQHIFCSSINGELIRIQPDVGSPFLCECYGCFRPFALKDHLRYHLMNEHKIEQRNGLIQCPWKYCCDRVYAADLGFHLRDVHLS